MATVKRTPTVEPAEPEEISLLRALETAERRILILIGKKEDDVEIHNEGIKAARNDRRSILDAITDYRNGVRALPMD